MYNFLDIVFPTKWVVSFCIPTSSVWECLICQNFRCLPVELVRKHMWKHVQLIFFIWMRISIFTYYFFETNSEGGFCLFFFLKCCIFFVFPRVLSFYLWYVIGILFSSSQFGLRILMMCVCICVCSICRHYFFRCM